MLCFQMLNVTSWETDWWFFWRRASFLWGRVNKSRSLTQASISCSLKKGSHHLHLEVSWCQVLEIRYRWNIGNPKVLVNNSSVETKLGQSHIRLLTMNQLIFINFFLLSLIQYSLFWILHCKNKSFLVSRDRKMNIML